MIKATIKGKTFRIYTVDEAFVNSFNDENWREDEIPEEFATILTRYPVKSPDDGLHNHDIPFNKEIDDYHEAQMKWLANEVGDKNAIIERTDNPDDGSWKDPNNPTGKIIIL